MNRQRILRRGGRASEGAFHTALRHKQERWSTLAHVNNFSSCSGHRADEEPWLFHLGAEFTVDVEASYKPISGPELSLGTMNLLNNFPNENPFPRETGSKCPGSSPMVFAAGFYHARARYSF